MNKYQEVVLKLKFDILDEYKSMLLLYKDNDDTVKLYQGKIKNLEKELMKVEL